MLNLIFEFKQYNGCKPVTTKYENKSMDKCFAVKVQRRNKQHQPFM